jgi:hypothetical protein
VIRVFVIALVLTACGAKGGAEEPSSNKALVKLTSNVRDAEVYVDGRLIGRVGSLRGGVLMKAGVHRIELRHDEYYSAYAEITVAVAEKRALPLDLAPILP